MNQSERPARRVPVASLVFGWLLIAGLAALSLVPHVPRTLLGWIVFAVVAPPLWFIGEMAATKYVSGWGERNLVQKVLKAVALVAMALVLIIAWVVFGT